MVGAFTIVANVAMAITPNEVWDIPETVHYVATQKAISDITGHPIDNRVRRGATLPPWGPADQLFIVGKCDGLYISNGESYVTVPNQQYQRDTWMVVERGHQFQHTYRLVVHQPAPDAQGHPAAWSPPGPAPSRCSSSRPTRPMCSASI